MHVSFRKENRAPTNTEISKECIICGQTFTYAVKPGAPTKICTACKSKKRIKAIVQDDSILTQHDSTLACNTEQAVVVEPGRPGAFPITLHANKGRTRIVADCTHQMKYAETEIEIREPDGDVIKRIQISVNPLGWTMKVLHGSG